MGEKGYNRGTTGHCYDPFFKETGSQRAHAGWPDSASWVHCGHRRWTWWEDGGAVSPSGTVESGINLEIALRLDAILGLYGADTVLLRTEDISLHDPDAQTLREKKASDLHNRVEMVESIPNALLVSIHQNTYTGSRRYHGAQVFYEDEVSSRQLAEHAQEILRQSLDPANTRQAAKLPGTVYLMEHITCPAILVECGFLSNPEEDALLRTAAYQTKLAAALASALLSHVPMAEE